MSQYKQKLVGALDELVENTEGNILAFDRLVSSEWNARIAALRQLVERLPDDVQPAVYPSNTTEGSFPPVYVFFQSRPCDKGVEWPSVYFSEHAERLALDAYARCSPVVRLRIPRSRKLESILVDGRPPDAPMPASEKEPLVDGPQAGRLCGEGPEYTA